MYSDILSAINSTSDIRLLKQEVGVLLDSLYSSKSSEFDKTLDAKVRESVSQSIKDALQKNNVDPEEFLKGLLQEVDKLAVLRLTLSFEPSKLFMDKLGDWVETNIGQKTVLDIRIDKAIIGGAVVEFKGHYFDFSLRKKTDDVLRKLPLREHPLKV